MLSEKSHCPNSFDLINPQLIWTSCRRMLRCWGTGLTKTSAHTNTIKQRSNHTKQNNLPLLLSSRRQPCSQSKTKFIQMWPVKSKNIHLYIRRPSFSMTLLPRWPINRQSMKWTTKVTLRKLLELVMNHRKQIRAIRTPRSLSTITVLRRIQTEKLQARWSCEIHVEWAVILLEQLHKMRVKRHPTWSCLNQTLKLAHWPNIR